MPACAGMTASIDARPCPYPSPCPFAGHRPPGRERKAKPSGAISGPKRSPAVAILGTNDGALPPQTATGVAMKKSSTHVVSLTGQEPSLQVPGGSMTHVDASVFPILERLSIRRLLLAPRGVREPHWHANCHELAYCVRGEALVTIFEIGRAH